MKRAFFASLMIAALGPAAECFAAGGCPNGGCPSCKPGIFQRCAGLFHAKRCPGCGKACGPFHRCALLHRRAADEDLGYGGPAAAQITYPYYTNRGPRDFLDPNPPSIGP
ncbi:MAG: hypothetical protein B7Z73_09120 [Planctomycetia bacterium 21-64-5]|nr:MAG: hypothetical protein B7Z73_09120 [Planctomycetia bacterium 21-64-5]HQU41839.1 hypothetical protein [Pirellulales bacterium]